MLDMSLGKATTENCWNGFLLFKAVLMSRW